MPHTYRVEVAEEEGGPEPELRERWAICVARRFRVLEEDGAPYPEAGGEVDILDNLEGKFIWEVTDEEFEADPPTGVAFEILGVDPVTAPTEPGPVTVRVRVPF